MQDCEKLQLPRTATNNNSDYQLIAANGTKLDISQRVFLNLTIGGKSILHPFCVFKSINHSIIGWDAIKKYNIILANGEFFVDSNASQKLNKLSRNNNVIVKRNYAVKRGETKQILAHIRKPIDFKEGEAVLIEDIRMANDERRNSDVRVIPELYDIEKQGNLHFQICNITTGDINVKPGEIVAVFDTLVQPPVDQFRPDYKHIDIDLDNIIKAPLPPEKANSVHDLLLEMDLGPMNPLEKEQLLKVMAQSIKAFARYESDIGCFGI